MELLMRLPALVLASMLSATLALAPGCASIGTPAKDALTSALANAARSDTDRERDLRDHPSEVLGLAGFKPGMKIADIFGGGGYYSEIIASIVGPRGHVRLINNPPYDGYAKKGLEKRFAGGRLSNVSYEVLPPEDMKLGRGTLDGALIVMSYHDLYVADPADNWPAIDAGQFIDQIVAGLKHGGVLLIVDHEAQPGTGKDDAQKLHRIEASYAIADFKAHGLQFVGSLPVLANSEDDHSLNVFDKAIRGKTDRFVHLYRKP
jgi:predicted methyltransferase